MADKSEIHPVDRFVGLRLRALRRDAGISQNVLGNALGITFQQIQKYENGQNRISASVLFEAAHTLGVGVAVFFDGYEPPAEETPRARSRSGGRPRLVLIRPAA